DRNEAFLGDELPKAARLALIEEDPGPAEVRSTMRNIPVTIWNIPSATPQVLGATRTLRGVVSDERYANASEQAELRERSPALGRGEATRGALIPIRKSDAWWALPQDERRAIFEERSHHIAIGLQYLPAVARRLHHSRDLGEPFDFLTWFEFAPA